MGKLTQIDRQFMGDNYNLWEDGKRVAIDVPFSVLAAAPEMLEALKLAVHIFEERLSQTDDMRPVYEALAKAEGRD